MGFDRPLAYSHSLQGGGWVIEMCLQWKGRLVVTSLWCLGIKVSSVRNPLRWPRRGGSLGMWLNMQIFPFHTFVEHGKQRKARLSLFSCVWLLCPLSVGQTLKKTVYHMSNFLFQNFSSGYPITSTVVLTCCYQELEGFWPTWYHFRKDTST